MKRSKGKPKPKSKRLTNGELDAVSNRIDETNSYMLDGAPSFIIDKVFATKCDGLGCEFGQVTVIIKTPSALFNKLKKKGGLGELYLDVSNEVYALNSNVRAYCPTVNSDDRSSGGIKTIRLYYYVRTLEECKAIGLEVHEFKNSWSVKYGAYVDLSVRQAPKLKLVQGGA